MRLDDDYEENSGGLPVIYMALGVSVFLLLVIGIVVAFNSNTNKNNKVSDPVVTAEVNDDEFFITPYVTKRVASDLDIWDMYPESVKDKKEEITEETTEAEPSVTITPTPQPTITPDYDDGEHVKITYADGSEEWIAINNKIEKNNYDYNNLVDSGGKYKYMSDGRNVSFVGIDVSRYQKEIDFKRIKEQGIDFAMIRVGSRGYKNGTLTIDEYFESNLNNALEAGIDVGVYFYSQAINTAEAEEEATMVINALGDKKITYPVAFDMEYVDNDNSRIDTLSKEEKTIITAAFVNKIKDAGFIPMIYGNKEWLLKRIDISKFTTSSIWLAQEDKQPDYPYLFDMWQYSTKGELYGIDGSVDMNICFVDYRAQ